MDKMLINSYVLTIDNQDINEIENLKKKYSMVKNDIIYEIYEKDLLTFQSLKFIIEKCANYLNISDSLIKRLIKDNKIELVNFIFSKFTFFDIKEILNFLIYYKNKAPMSSAVLKRKISNKKFKFSKKDNYIENLYPYYGYLFNACKNGKEHIFNYLIKFGMNKINKGKSYNLFNNKPLHYACEGGNEYIVKYLVEHGEDVNKQNSSGCTPLFFACDSKNETIVKYLIENGADINVVNNLGYTALLYACYSGNKNIVKYLIEHGANYKNNYSILLINACESGSINLVKYLMELNDYELILHLFNHNDDTYISMLFTAAQSNDDLIKYLIEFKTNISFKFN